MTDRDRSDLLARLAFLENHLERCLECLFEIQCRIDTCEMCKNGEGGAQRD